MAKHQTAGVGIEILAGVALVTFPEQQWLIGALVSLGLFLIFLGPISSLFLGGDIAKRKVKKTSYRDEIVRPNIWLLEVIYYVAFRKWGVPNRTKLTVAQKRTIKEAHEKIEQQAYKGELPIWGKGHVFKTFQNIEWYYWYSYGIESDGILHAKKEDLKTIERRFDFINKKTKQGFTELKTSKRRVEQLWPPIISLGSNGK